MENIHEAREEHLQIWVRLASELWPDADVHDLENEFPGFLASDRDKILLFHANDEYVAFLQLSLRTDYVEGSDSRPTGYIEGIYVKPEFRRKGISRRLVIEGEKWLKSKGCTQVGSDAYIDNHASYGFHTSVGFEEAGRIIHFIKNLD